MNELLKLCGYDEKEIKSELPRVEKAFKKLGINDDDIEQGKQRLNKYYAVEMEGIRKLFRFCLREFVNSVLAREDGKKKIIYGFMSPGIDVIGSAVISKSNEVFSAHQSWAFLLVVGCIFGKLVPILEAAEEKWLKAGVVAHCGNVKTFLGQIALDLIPKPDLMVTTGSMCETAPKTLDMLQEIYDIPLCCFDTCMDRESGEYSDATKRAINLAGKSLRKLAERIQEVVGFEITDDMLWEVMDSRSKFQKASGKIQRLIERSDPLPISPTHNNLWMCLGALTLSLDNLPEVIDALDLVYEELQERVNKGLGVVEKGAPRILTLCPAHHSDPRLEHLLVEQGIAVAAVDTGFMVPSVETPKDPYEAISMNLQGSMFTSLPTKVPLIIEGCKKLNIDGVLDRFHAGCRIVTSDALIIEEAVKKELGIPVLILEWENFDPRVYDHEDYKRRLEVFKEMMTKSAS
ncbi:2-hydroxyacyl-CoA dehydratase [Chloroflexota bacterium]